MKKIERFAQVNFGIDLFPIQLELIETLVTKTYTKRFPRMVGKSTARNIYQAWCKSALEEE